MLINQFDENDCYYWSTHQGAELDFLVMHKGKRLGYEIKLSERSSTSK